MNTLCTLLSTAALSIHLLAPTLQAQQSTARASEASGGGEGNFDSGFPSISATGRFVAFHSSATNLVPSDTNGWADIFVLDRKTSALSRVSVDSQGGQADSYSLMPSISSNGRFVAFESNATNLVSGDTNGLIDTFLHDRKQGTTVRVSLGVGGAEPDAHCRSVWVSGNGRYVFYDSTATNLVPTDTNGELDSFRYDTKKQKTIRVSVHTDGTQGDGASTKPRSSKNGRFVVFHSAARTLIDSDTNNFWDVFLHDCKKGVTTRVGTGMFGAEPNESSTFAGISGNGRFVGFGSDATNLVPGVDGSFRNVYVYDRKSGSLTRISVGLGVVDADSNFGGFSSNGRFAMLSSASSNLVPNDTNGTWDVFLWDRKKQQMSRMSVASDGTEGNGESRFAALASKKARYVAYGSKASNLIAGDTNSKEDVFVTKR